MCVLASLQSLVFSERGAWLMDWPTQLLMLFRSELIRNSLQRQDLCSCLQDWVVSQLDGAKHMSISCFSCRTGNVAFSDEVLRFPLSESLLYKILQLNYSHPEAGDLKTGYLYPTQANVPEMWLKNINGSFFNLKSFWTLYSWPDR